MLGSPIRNVLAVALASFFLAPPQAKPFEEPGFTTLFNGVDLTGWKVPDGDNGHWKVVDGVIDYDARSESKGSRDLISRTRNMATLSSSSIGGSRRPPGSIDYIPVHPARRLAMLGVWMARS